VDTVGGVERITSSGEAPRWTVTPLLELGSDAGVGAPADDEFAWVSAVSIGPDGRVYVADLGNDRIVVFDTLGVRRDVIGRDGRGPGEFQALYSIAWIGDHLATLDLGNGRLDVRSASGAWQVPRPAPGRLVASPVTYRLYQVGPEEVYQWAYRMVDDLLEPTWRRHSRDSAVAEWPRQIDDPLATFPDKVVCTRGRGFSWFDHPYVPRALAHPARDDRSIAALTSAYRIAVVSATHDTLRIIERTVEPPHLTDAEWSRTTDRFNEWLSDKDVAACQPKSLERPPHKPFIESLMVGVDGRIWVERNLAEGTVWEVFDERGQLIGSVGGFEHDRQRTVPWLGEDRIAWVSRGPMDVPHVHVARLSRSARPD
jgi:hypothetical protein